MIIYRRGEKLIAYVIIIQPQLYVMRSTFQTLDWIPSMAKCLCLDSSCEPSGPDYSDPKQVGDIDFLVRKAQIRSCPAHWIQAGVPGCSNLSVLAARMPVSATPYRTAALENFNAEVSPVAGTPFKELTGEYMKRHKLSWKKGKFCHSKKPDKSIFVANLSSATNYWHDDSTSVSFAAATKRDPLVLMSSTILANFFCCNCT